MCVLTHEHAATATHAIDVITAYHKQQSLSQHIFTFNQVVIRVRYCVCPLRLDHSYSHHSYSDRLHHPWIDLLDLEKDLE